MTGDESVQLVKGIYSLWNHKQGPDSAAYTTWHRYIGHYDVDKVQAVVDRYAMSTKWMPTPAMIREAVVDPDLPTPQRAWTQAQSLIKAVANGTGLPMVHPVVAETASQITGGLTERGFLALYEENKGNYLYTIFEGENLA